MAYMQKEKPWALKSNEEKFAKNMAKKITKNIEKIIDWEKMFEEFKNKNWIIIKDMSASDSIRVSVYRRHTCKISKLHDRRRYFPATRHGTIKAHLFFEKIKKHLRNLED